MARGGIGSGFSKMAVYSGLSHIRPPEPPEPLVVVGEGPLAGAGAGAGAGTAVTALARTSARDTSLFILLELLVDVTTVD